MRIAMRFPDAFAIFACAFLALVPCAPASAHPVTVDGSAADWFPDQPPYANFGEIFRNGSGEGEYVWRDLADDYRMDLGVLPWPDITEFRVTGGASLSLLIRT